jgi:uncharacterized delta-60 repeat protein
MEFKKPFATKTLNKIRLFITLVVIGVFLLNLKSATLAHEGNPDENLDPSFGNGGKVVTDFTGSTDVGFALAIQADGKMIVGGSVANVPTNGTDYGLARYNSDGSLDQSFGTGGRVMTDVGGQGDFISAIGLQSDGKIVAAGFSFTDNIFDFSVARYNANGTLDNTFGNGGRVLTDFQNNDDEAFGMVIQPDGKIVLAGFTADSNFDLDFALLRYNPDGSLDNSFGIGGKVTSDFSGSDDQSFALLRQADGKLVAAGAAINSQTFESEFALARFNIDGSLDGTFGKGGKTTTAFGESSGISSILLLPGGKIMTAGYAFTTHEDQRPNHGEVTGDFALARYNSDGSLDESFGEEGKVTSDFFGEDDAINAIALQADGKIIAAGSAVEGHRDESRILNQAKSASRLGISRPTGSQIARPADGELDPSAFALARYQADGSLDDSFGGDGKVVAEIAHDVNIAFAVAIQSDGRIVAAGRAGSFLHPDFGIARFLMSSFDLCLQDDRNGNLLRLNSTTGDYQFQNCSKGFRLEGVGKVTINGCKVTLTDSGVNPKSPDRNIQASINLCTKLATATVLMSSPFSRSEIDDQNITNNLCLCP